MAALNEWMYAANTVVSRNNTTIGLHLASEMSIGTLLQPGIYRLEKRVLQYQDCNRL